MTREAAKLAIEQFEPVRTIGEIQVFLPEPPKWNNIANYNLPDHKQFFPYPKVPENITEGFLHQEAERLNGGFWFFNGGRLEYISDTHYMLLSYWRDKGKILRFIDAQRDVGLWWQQIENMKNMAGGNLATNRRFGKTVWGTCILYKRTTSGQFRRGGMQSKTNEDVKTIFKKLVSSWTQLQEFLKPVDSGESRPATILEFSEPRKRNAKDVTKIYGEALNSSIDHRSSVEEAYDGEELYTMYEDECHTKGTLVLMLNGSYKTVEDIIIGDKIMGDDSTERSVLSLTNGTTQCYQVSPNASGWDGFGCNENHLLSLIWSSRGRQHRFKFGQVYNISVKDYLKLTDYDKNHFCLYRKPVEYPENKIMIDPYFMGIWLGDGNCRDIGITNIDKEIVDYIHQTAKKYKLRVRVYDGKTYHIASETTKKGCNKILTAIQSYNLIGNKHIPKDYLINNRKERLKLLAGIIDTDGHADQIRRKYEITQKNETLAKDIQRLASELGFKANMVSKIATMKRADGSVYRCKVYRIGIYGLNLHEIPCLVPRKRYKEVEVRHKNTRNSLKTCFSIQDTGQQEYFGFSLDGNNLFMLKDCTISHNCGKTKEINTDTRYYIYRFCLQKGSAITGKTLRTTTVEDMEKKGGANFKKTWDASRISTINPKTGRTESYLTNLFIPADYGYVGEHPVTGVQFVDDHGYSNREAAREFILSLWENLDGEDLSKAQQKDPLSEKHMWQAKNFGGCFRNDLLQIQLDYLERTNSHADENAPDNLVARVTFYKDEQGVKIRHDKNGDCQMVWDFNNPPVESNKNGIGKNGYQTPGNTDSFAIGVDPIGATTTTGKENSQAVAYVYRKGDLNDPENSGLVVLRYAPVRKSIKRKRDFHKYIMMLCEYYGCKANYESDIDDYYETFEQEGFVNYVMMRPKNTIDPNRKRAVYKYGTPSKDPYALQRQHDIAYDYIVIRYHKIYFVELVTKLIGFDPDNRTDFDDCIAFFMALIGGTDKKQDNKTTKSNLAILPVFNPSSVSLAFKNAV